MFDLRDKKTFSVEEREQNIEAQKRKSKKTFGRQLVNFVTAYYHLEVLVSNRPQVGALVRTNNKARRLGKLTLPAPAALSSSLDRRSVPR